MAVTFGSETIAAELAAAEAATAPAKVETPTKEPESPPEPSAPAEGDKPEAESKTADASETPGEGEAARPPKRADGGFQRRIDQLTREKREAQRKIEELEAKLNGNQAPATSAAPAATADPDKEPQESDFEDYAQYAKAMGAYGARQALKEEREREQAEAAQKAFSERLQTAKAKHADFEDVIASGADIPIPPAAEAAINSSDDPGEIMYHLASHPEEAEKLLGMTPQQQFRYVTLLEARLTDSPAGKEPAAPPTPKPRPAASTAPPPLKPVPGSSSEKPTFDPHKGGSDEDWKKYRAQRREQLAALDA